MLVSRAMADRWYEKMTAKKNLVGITLCEKGYFQSWKEDSLEFCNYVLYYNGALLYRKGSTFLASNAALQSSQSITYAGSHTLLTEMDGGQFHYFGKKHPLDSGFSLVMAFRHKGTIILIIADARFSKRPEYYEFPATKSAVQLCLLTAHHAIAMRDRPSADRMEMWLGGVRHPLGKLPKRNLPSKPMEEPSAEKCAEENPTVSYQEEKSMEQMLDACTPLPCIQREELA